MTWQFTLTGLLIGVLVGLTGMGGGALMTPILATGSTAYLTGGVIPKGDGAKDLEVFTSAPTPGGALRSAQSGRGSSTSSSDGRFSTSPSAPLASWWSM